MNEADRVAAKVIADLANQALTAEERAEAAESKLAAAEADRDDYKGAYELTRDKYKDLQRIHGEMTVELERAEAKIAKLRGDAGKGGGE